MPFYQVVTSPGLDYPVGKVFETDNLHRVMKQHVALVKTPKAEASAKPVDDVDEDEKELALAWDEAHAEAALMALAEAEKTKVKVPKAKVEKTTAPADDDNT